MRIGVLDVGSNSAHLKIVDLVEGEPPRTVATLKHPTRLARAIGPDGVIDDEAVRLLGGAVGQAACTATLHRVDELIAFATSAVRDAANRDEVVDRIADGTGIELGFLTGGQEASLTFQAVRAWYGWSVRRLLVVDIGGGSLEIAAGDGREPDTALSLPLGADRLTRRYLPGDPPSPERVRRLRRHVRRELAAAVAPFAGDLDARTPGTLAVGTSRVLTQLAVLGGAPKPRKGPYARRVLHRARLRGRIDDLAAMTAAQRAGLRGISVPRAPHILAGGIVADATMSALHVKHLDVCPWALREGVILQRWREIADPAREPTRLPTSPRPRSHLHVVPPVSEAHARRADRGRDPEAAGAGPGRGDRDPLADGQVPGDGHAVEVAGSRWRPGHRAGGDGRRERRAVGLVVAAGPSPGAVPVPRQEEQPVAARQVQAARSAGTAGDPGQDGRRGDRRP
ncbi:hypothetical protein [Actinomadura sp. WMMB 499]|uniref:Ppx/GppA phosphatase family protein n=1 Tax=Actinomadura sp. WMMB 499 TaxID=1219491 RepID=UPI001248201C|nr:hypothetical protein [Actinomadura sp. WMMB 499]QFG20739.1 hypothetical protein F7P10_05830 [Actinomadura sp. WMMB 499]